jgi:hypothetical protein
MNISMNNYPENWPKGVELESRKSHKVSIPIAITRIVGVNPDGVITPDVSNPNHYPLFEFCLSQTRYACRSGYDRAYTDGNMVWGKATYWRVPEPENSLFELIASLGVHTPSRLGLPSREDVERAIQNEISKTLA